jgi:hypothetical protein
MSGVRIRGLVARIGRAFRAALLIAFNTLLLFAAANVVADLYLRRERPEVSAEERRRARGDQAIARYGIDFYRRLYPGKSEAEVRQIIYDQPELTVAYEPFAEFRSTAIATTTLNIHQAGFRLVGAEQGPWPLEDKAVNIFVFGGSTTVGSGVDDDRTIPAALQSILRERGRSGEATVNVYNFGVGAFFSSQEVTYFQNQLRYGHIPDMVVFVDGLNDFHYWDGDPSTAKISRHMLHLVQTMSRQMGREQGVSWHVVELLKSLPLVKLAQDVAATSALKLSREERPDRGSFLIDSAAAAAPADDIYAAIYSDGLDVTDPRRIRAVMTRYLVNKKIAQGVADQLDITAIFAWQPVPLYKYKLVLHPFAIADDHRRIRYGYPAMAQHVATHDMGANFAWCADIAESAEHAIYVDQVHYTMEGNRMVADCIARTILASGALERARQRARHRTEDGPLSVATVAETPTPAPMAIRVIAPLFGSKAVVGGLDMPRPLAAWGDLASNGVRLADASAGYAGIYEDFPLERGAAERTHRISVRIKPDTSDYLGLVLDCLGGPKPENYVLFINPQTMGVITSNGFHELVPEPDGWVRVSLAGACTDPAQDRVRVSLYPEHGEAKSHGAIMFGGGEFARFTGARLTSSTREPAPTP